VSASYVPMPPRNLGCLPPCQGRTLCTGKLWIRRRPSRLVDTAMGTKMALLGSSVRLGIACQLSGTESVEMEKYRITAGSSHSRCGHCTLQSKQKQVCEFTFTCLLKWRHIPFKTKSFSDSNTQNSLSVTSDSRPFVEL